MVVGPDDVPMRDIPVFLSHGDGSLEQLTSDATGRFRLELQHSDYQRATLLICVPGVAPNVAHPVENLRTAARYRITVQPRGIGPSDIRALGWRHLIPRECLSYSRF